MGKTSYKNTEELIKELSRKMDQLNKGDLDLEGLNSLVDCGKDLYEQLIVLRYKAFDKYGDPTESVPEAPAEIEIKVEEPKVVIKEEEPSETPFDFTGITTEASESEPQPSFDFTVDEEEIVEEEVVPEKPAAAFTENITDNNNDDVSNSLNQVLKQEDELSLRKKLQNSPISDIKTHISIAKKFEYISNMFDGDSSVYDEAIDFLNTCATGNDARLKLNEYTTTYNWDLEDKSIIKFIELVERRYL